MRVVIGVALVGLVVCVGCGPEPEAVPHEPIQPNVSKEAVSDEPPSPKLSQEEAIAAIKELGGKVKVDENNALEQISFPSSRNMLTDAGLVHLKGLAGLKTLGFFRTPQITDAGLVHLKGLTKLQFLLLGGTKATDVGIKKLKQALPNCKISH